MTRKQFADWLTSKGACDPALVWLASVPGRSIRKVWFSCPEPGWLLWWAEVALGWDDRVADVAKQWLPPEVAFWLYPDLDNLSAEDKAGAVEDIREILSWEKIESATLASLWS